MLEYRFTRYLYHIFTRRKREVVCISTAYQHRKGAFEYLNFMDRKWNTCTLHTPIDHLSGFSGSFFSGNIIKLIITLIVCHDPSAQVMYVSGGYDKGTNELSSTIIAYDGNLEASILQSPMKVARDGHASIFFNGKLIICGGFADGNNTNIVEYYDPRTSTSGYLPSTVKARYSFALFVHENRLYAVGGDDAETIEVLDDEQSRWRIIASVKSKRAHAAVAYFESRLYFFGGSSAYFTEDATWDSFDLRSRSWYSDHHPKGRELPITEYSNGYAAVLEPYSLLGKPR